MAMGHYLEAIFKLPFRANDGEEHMRLANTKQVIEALCSCAIAPPGLIVRLTRRRGFTLSMNSPGSLAEILVWLSRERGFACPIAWHWV
jgi:hypothetical protein